MGVNAPWWAYGLDFVVGALSGAAGMRLWDWWRMHKLFKDSERPEDSPGLH
jgi:hypothetical protein